MRLSSLVSSLGLHAIRDRRATAALEFAIVAPVVATFLAGASDYGLAMWSRSCLTNAVSQGAYYAFRTGTGVTPANVVSLVQGASSLAGVTATASSPTSCFCPSGQPSALGTAVACTTTCTDGSAPGNYMTITGSYKLTGNFTLAGLATKNVTVTDSVTVRLK